MPRFVERQIAVNGQFLPGMQDRRRAGARHQPMLHRHGTLFHQDHGGLFLVVHRDVEDGAAHADDRGGREDAVRVGLSSRTLDMHADAAQPDVEQVAQIARVGAECDL